MTPDLIRRLYDFNSWANRRILDACGVLTPEEFTREMGVSFGSVRGTLVHILGAEWLWLERWHGRSHSALPPAAEFTNLGSARQRWAQIEGDLAEFVAGLTAEDLARPLAYKNTAGQPFAEPLWQQMQHVVNHGSYHRGQVTSLLRQLGHKALATDLIAFYRERAAGAGA